MGAVTALKSNDLKGVAAQIGANESRHLSVLTNIAAGRIVPAPALPQVFSAAQATKAVRRSSRSNAALDRHLKASPQSQRARGKQPAAAASAASRLGHTVGLAGRVSPTGVSRPAA